MIDGHVWRPMNDGSGKPRDACQFMNCRRARSEHVKAKKAHR